MLKNSNTAYVIGVSIGDGNLSNPNKRAVRLRITCDLKYPQIIKNIIKALEKTFPNNKINIVNGGKNYINISCYSNKLEKILGWKHDKGSKFKQNVRVPKWIFNKKIWIRNCLRGLIETDGSIYKDRNYTYVNFTTIIKNLSLDVEKMLVKLNYKHSTQIVSEKTGNKKTKYVIRVCKNSQKFIKELKLEKK